MKRLGIDLGVLDGHTVTPVGAPGCPGGLLRITRYDYDSYVAGGERFVTPRQELPFDAMGSARIRCTNPVAQLPSTSAGGLQFYGLCHSCSGAEAKNREDLRRMAKTREGAR